MKRLPLPIASALAAAILSALVHGQDLVKVSSCPASGKLQVPFQVDCTKVADAAAKAKCRPFAENQACKVFPAYRTITGIQLEDICPVITYASYDTDKWPYQDSKDGGRSDKCGAQILTDFSLFNTSSRSWPHRRA